MPPADLPRSRTLPLLTASAFVDGFNLIVAAPLLLLYKNLGVALPVGFLLFFPLAAIAGNLVGGLLLGHLGDVLGRRRAFLWDLGFFVVLPVLSAVAPLALLPWLRLALGVGIGGNYPLGSVLLAESSPDARRGRRVALLGVAWTFGAFSTYALAALLYPLGALAPGLLLVAAVVPATVVLLLRYRLPESHSWSAWARARTVRERREGASPARLAAPALRARTVYAAGFWFLFDIVQYGVSLFLPLLLVAFGRLSGPPALALAALLYAGELGGTVVGAALVDRVGRRPLQLAGFAAMTLGLGLAYLLPGLLGAGPLGLVALLLVVTAGVGVGPGVLEFVYPPELFPTGVRATGSGFALSMSRVGAIVGVVAGALIASRRELFGLYALVALATLLFTWFLAPETRGAPLPPERPEPVAPPGPAPAAGGS